MTLDGYLLCIIGTVLLSSILTAIVPEGKTSAVIKGIAKLVCLLVIVSPIPRFLQKENFFDEADETFFSQTVIQTDEDFIKYYSEMRIKNAESALEQELEKNFSVVVKLSLEWEYGEDTNEIKITKIHVEKESEIDEEGEKVMWEYLTKNYCSEVLIE